MTAMSPELMITVAFCSYVLIASLALGLLMAQSARKEGKGTDRVMTPRETTTKQGG